MAPDGRTPIMRVPTRREDPLRKRLQQFTRMLHGLDEGDARALHRTRIASRRLRELLPVLHLDADVATKLSRRLRNVTKRLGTIRELDVLLRLIDELHESGRYDEDSLSRLTAFVSEERVRARERLLVKLPTAELHGIAARLDKIARRLKASDRSSASADGSAMRSSRFAVEARMTRRSTALRTAMQHAGAVYLPERLHAVRIALKKLRYAVELSAELARALSQELQKRTTSDLRTLKHVQEVLGRLHDLQILIDRARQLQASLTPPNVTVWRELDALVVSLENDCRRLHARYMHERSKLLTICDRVGTRPQSPAARRAV